MTDPTDYTDYFIKNYLDSLKRLPDSSEDVELALSLIEASGTGNIPALRTILATIEERHPLRTRIEASLSFPHPGRPLSLSLDCAAVKAVSQDETTSLSVILDFASQHGIEVVGTPTITIAIKRRHLASLRVLAARDPAAFVTYKMSHLGKPLDLAAQRRDLDVVALILELGKDTEITDMSSKLFDYINHQTLMGFGIENEDTRILSMLLARGAPVARALHYAAELGHLDAMRLLMQYGAGVNDLYGHEKEKSIHTPPWQHSWTPLHFAASTGRVLAMQLLESSGAQPDVEDSRGMTPAQVLKQWEQEREAKKSAVTLNNQQ